MHWDSTRTPSTMTRRDDRGDSSSTGSRLSACSEHWSRRCHIKNLPCGMESESDVLESADQSPQAGPGARMQSVFPAVSASLHLGLHKARLEEGIRVGRCEAG